MEGISAHEPHPKKDESHTERPNPDETHEERPNPFVGKEHLSALRKAIAIAIASGFVVSSQPPAEAAPVTKPTDDTKDSVIRNSKRSAPASRWGSTTSKTPSGSRWRSAARKSRMKSVGSSKIRVVWAISGAI